ncbi:hypothetical protein SERLA73DRAFT_178602 [Serpula lacrymans var. lacrymans S7.3]|uniref:Uncharacterized protein n=2 Tax=Serpula lacrymans var. lacrymans TaxID=341189 RepID=F8PS96_SERL3|nr:uncharacterized protein SERLADRAFT_463109 [Serpula lacrymans var. lacrymans S7.9]EGO00709.1 hypothetical protein SERLA73DRAFT_178602 [Serpula lacrymans var. lacrymans S7.3]EGO26256.1 hypothetical protein SERLADRAFT_463109 [Serpula lacrymans var. lacrymans S7.9]
MVLMQAVVTFQVWHLFTHSKLAQSIIAHIYLACTFSQTILMGYTYHKSPLIRAPIGANLTFCGYLPPITTWHVYIPAMVLHVTMYGLTVYRVKYSSASIVSRAFVRRFIGEGAPMYLIATAFFVLWLVAMAMSGHEGTIAGFNS